MSQWQERLKHVFEIAVNQGIPLESVAILPGHSSVKTTEKHYAAALSSATAAASHAANPARFKAIRHVMLSMM
jgi:hypothetical protein